MTSTKQVPQESLWKTIRGVHIGCPPIFFLCKFYVLFIRKFGPFLTPPPLPPMCMSYMEAHLHKFCRQRRGNCLNRIKDFSDVTCGRPLAGSGSASHTGLRSRRKKLARRVRFVSHVRACVHCVQCSAFSLSHSAFSPELNCEKRSSWEWFIRPGGRRRGTILNLWDCPRRA